MRLHLKQCIGGLALCAMALPLWARTDTASVTLSQTATIEGTQLAPGTYQIKIPVDGNQLKVIGSNGKVIAQVPYHWVSLNEKADYTQVVFQQSTITEVEFGGKKQAAMIG